jgi:hypothetical protein
MLKRAEDRNEILTLQDGSFTFLLWILLGKYGEAKSK